MEEPSQKRCKLEQEIGDLSQTDMNATKPIPALGDAQLIRIFSYIQDVRFKFQLEGVCKRFRSLLSEPASWAYNDWLQIEVYPLASNGVRGHGIGMRHRDNGYYSDSDDLPPNRFTDFDGTEVVLPEIKREDRTGQKLRFTLNEIPIKLEQYPAMLSKLLSRTTIRIRTLILDVGKVPRGWMEKRLGRPINDGYVGGFEEFALTPSFESNPSSLAHLERIIFDRGNASTDTFLFWLLDKSCSTLKWLECTFGPASLTLWRESFCPGLPPAIKNCNKLRTLIFYMPTYSLPLGGLVTALKGKPLKYINIKDPEREHKPNRVRKFLVGVSNGVSEEGGIGELRFWGRLPSDVTDLYDGLNDHARKSLKMLVMYYLNSKNLDRMLPIAFEFPLLFPHLETFEYICGHVLLSEAKFLKTEFFTVANRDPSVKRQLDLSNVRVNDQAGFEEKLERFCARSGIQLKIENNQEEHKRIATLSKDNATIIIRF